MYYSLNLWIQSIVYTSGGTVALTGFFGGDLCGSTAIVYTYACYIKKKSCLVCRRIVYNIHDIFVLVLKQELSDESNS